MICTQCGWQIEEEYDCHCSGCGKQIRGLALEGGRKQHYNLFYGGGSQPLSMLIENRGDPSLRTRLSWVSTGLNHVLVTVNGSAPPVELPGGERATLQVRFDGSGFLPQTGTLRLSAGICPPLELGIVCSPVPHFFFSINEQLVRDGTVTTVSAFPRKPELRFRIELRRCSDVVWNRFCLYPEKSPVQVYPLPPALSFPVTLIEGSPLDFTIVPEIPSMGKGPVVLTADFGFEGCDPQSFTIEILETPRVVHTQDTYLIGENALIPGKSSPRRIEVTLTNYGGIETKVLQVSSLSEPWLRVASQTDKSVLLPYGESQAKFSILVDMTCFAEDDKLQKAEGRLALYLQGVEAEQILALDVELKQRERLYYPLAVDLGNNGSCVAYLHKGKIDLAYLDEDYPDQLEFPTIIDFERFNEPETGEGFRYGYWLEQTRYAAGDEGYSNFLHRVWSFKPLLGADNCSISRLDSKKTIKQFKAAEIISFYLKEIIRRFERISGFIVGSIILTYPACMGLSRLEQLKKTAEAATGHEIITQISEPEALALHHFRRRTIERPILFAVFDFGGGTTDISIGRVVVREDDGVRVVSILTSVGMENLGGDSLSFQLGRDIYEKAAAMFQGSDRLFPDAFEDIFRISFAEREKLLNFMNIMHLAEGFKTNRNKELDELVNNGKVSLSLFEFYSRRAEPAEKCRIEYSLEDFDRVVLSRIRRGFTKLHDTADHIKGNGIVSSDERIEVLILGGNSSRLPFVKDIAKEVLGLPDERILFDGSVAKTAVALGAAYYGELMEDPNLDIDFENPRHICYPLGRKNKEQFQTLFPVGSRFGGEPIEWVCNMKAPKPVLKLFWNFDPSNTRFDMNRHIKPAAVYSLEKYKSVHNSRLKLHLKLTMDGIEIKPDGDHEPDLIPIEF